MGVGEKEEFYHALESPPVRSQSAASGEAVTSVNSWWNHHRCKTCGHSFRRGDRVLLDQDETGGVRTRHLDSVLGCAHADAHGDTHGEAEAGEADRARAEIAAFGDGLQSAWPPPVGLRITRLGPGHRLLDRPDPPFERATCMFCSHTFRSEELVIVCPCRPLEPLCQAAVHRDPVRGLVCWESWRPGNRMNICPISLRRLDGDG